jgi:SAM-dependent methyltransferase
MPDLEWLALNECRGDILDIGAGAGAHVLILQDRGFDVTALDISKLASDIMKVRGVNKVLTTDIFEYSEHQYDTLLLLMNGIGLTGTLLKLKAFLQHVKQLLKPGGQLLFDSSDIAYLYEGKLPENGPYYGEIQYQYQYGQQKTDWFPWLYIDEQTLTGIAEEMGYNMEVLLEDEFKQYLVRLTLK